MKRTMRRWIGLGCLLLIVAGAWPAHAFYNPTTGRWISRDPIAELGGENLHTFVGNNSINRWDYLGLQSNVMSIPAMIEAGWSAQQIAEVAGITVAAAAALIAADAVIQDIVNNAQKNAKGKDPCEKAKDALRQVQKGIQNTLDTIKQHQGYVNNPSSYPGGLRPPFDQHPEWAVDKWLKQIANMQTNLERMNSAVKALEKAVDVACTCWYKPWTWF